MSAIEYQRLIMSDRVRTDTFAKALRQTVTPGCTVIDVGSGTGFLAFLARKLGAERCILIEREEEFLELSQLVARKNGIRGCEFLHAHSAEIRGLPRADLVISETLGNFAYEENILETLADARRFLKKGGVMIPRRIEQYVAPLVTPDLWREIASWDHVGHDLDWSAARKKSMNNMYVKIVRPQDLLPGTGAAKRWDDTDLTGEKLRSIRTGELQWRIGSPVTIYGFALWWVCTLIPGIALSTSPNESPTHWQQIFLPVEQPLRLAKGETLRLRVRSDSRPAVKINVSWTAEQVTSSGKTMGSQSMDMRKG